jgi:hypothetical protein
VCCQSTNNITCVFFESRIGNDNNENTSKIVDHGCN